MIQHDPIGPESARVGLQAGSIHDVHRLLMSEQA